MAAAPLCNGPASPRRLIRMQAVCIHPTPTSISEMIKPASAPCCNTATVIGHCYRISASWFKINVSIYTAGELGGPAAVSSSQWHLFISVIHTVATFQGIIAANIICGKLDNGYASVATFPSSFEEWMHTYSNKLIPLRRKKRYLR